jgi:hypothetical protein
MYVDDELDDTIQLCLRVPSVVLIPLIFHLRYPDEATRITKQGAWYNGIKLYVLLQRDSYSFLFRGRELVESVVTMGQTDISITFCGCWLNHFFFFFAGEYSHALKISPGTRTQSCDLPYAYAYEA